MEPQMTIKAIRDFQSLISCFCVEYKDGCSTCPFHQFDCLNAILDQSAMDLRFIQLKPRELLQ